MPPVTTINITQSPGALGTAGVHPDVKIESYNLSPDGFSATPIVNMTVTATRKIRAKMKYAAELECEEADTRLWMHRWCIEKNNGQPALIPPILKGRDDLEPTVPNCISVAAQQYARNPCMGARPILQCVVEGEKQYWRKGSYQWQSYDGVWKNVVYGGRGLYDMPGIGSKRNSGKQVVAALLAETSQEWMMSALASLYCGITLTTVYSTLGPEAMLHGLRQTEAEIIFIDWMMFHKLKDRVLAQCPALKFIVFIGKDLVPRTEQFPTPEQADALGKVGNASCTTFENVVQIGQYSKSDVNPVKPKGSDVAMIMYTSGSTGMPKGVVLTHSNFVSVIASAVAQGTILPTPNDVLIAYLPLAHILELLVEIVALTQGASIGYAHPKTLSASSPYVKNQAGIPLPGFTPDLVALRPTLFAGVPAILDLICNGLKMRISKGFKGMLARSAIQRKRKLKPDCLTFAWMDRSILDKIRTSAGLDRCRLIISGGAPLSAETQEFVQIIFAPVAQGYGATETSACATVQECFNSACGPADSSFGRVGAIQPASEIKLVSVPDMGYKVTDSPPRGEILVSGNNVSQHGYYKLPIETAQAFILHPDGKIWFHTGDIGVMEGDGVLRIIDRKKDLVKLQGGEYVSLGKVEANLKQVKGIGACVVFAQSDKRECVAVVSQPERGWDSVGGRPNEAQLVADIKTKLKELGLMTFEIPQKVAIDDTVWTPESGLVTASMKVQRNALRQKYNQPGGILDRMQYRFPS